MTEPAVRALATDGVIIVGDGVVLLERDHDPYCGDWVLPGGLVEPTETARAACEREVAEEVGLDVTATAFVGLFDDPGRDPRGNVSAAYRCVPVSDHAPRALDEAASVGVFDPGDLPRTGFDHARIVWDATGTG